jgi:hypothetical protein
MNTTHNLKRTIAGALPSGGVAVAGLALGAGPTQANLPKWCPGQPLPNAHVAWNIGLCRYYSVDSAGVVHVIGDFLPPGAPPPPPPPKTPTVYGPGGCPIGHYCGL